MEARIHQGKVFVFIYSLLTLETFYQVWSPPDTTALYIKLITRSYHLTAGYHHWESQGDYEVTAVELKATPDWQVLQRKHSSCLQLFDDFFIWRHR